MPHAYDVLTPDSLAMLQVISETGSFAAAARHLGLVPSALSTGCARSKTPWTCCCLIAQPARHASKPRRAAARRRTAAARDRCRGTAWRHGHRLGAQLTIAVDGVVSTMLELVDAFYAMAPPTHLQTA